VKALLDRQGAMDKASENIIQVITTDQPPADLLVSITPGVRRLVETATHFGR
jgi:hypothetical protein